MAYATRQSTISFPKRKLRVSKKSLELSPEIKNSPHSRGLLTSTSSSARKALHSSASDGIIGREKEVKKLTDFLVFHANNQSSGSMYISGLPGTGKTATVNYVIKENAFDKKYQVIQINCTAFFSSKTVFNIIREKLKIKTSGKTEKNSISIIGKYLVKRHKMILLILDEIDQLESKSQMVLYKIFEWASWKNSKFVLIGIANNIDLTDRNLPRLCSKFELKPELLHFIPYTKDEITDILKNCLIKGEADKLFAPGAIELISAKIAGTSGDIRRALDLAKRVIEVVDQKTQEELKNFVYDHIENEEENGLSGGRKRKTSAQDEFIMGGIINKERTTNHKPNMCNVSPLKKLRSKYSDSSLKEISNEINNENLQKPKKSSFEEKLKRSNDFHSQKQINDENNSENINACDSVAEKTKNSLKCVSKIKTKSPTKLEFDVGSKDVLTVVKSAFGGQKNLKFDQESSFPLHQKLLICTLLLLIKKGKKKDISIGKLHQVYSKICSKRGLTTVDKSVFLFLCRQVELNGAIQIGKGPGTLAKVTLQWDESEVSNSIKDMNMLSSILSDVSCLD